MTRYTFTPCRASGVNQIAIMCGQVRIATLPAGDLDRAWRVCAKLNGRKVKRHDL
jgi:hypothetical protein